MRKLLGRARREQRKLLGFPLSHLSFHHTSAPHWKLRVKLHQNAGQHGFLHSHWVSQVLLPSPLPQKFNYQPALHPNLETCYWLSSIGLVKAYLILPAQASGSKSCQALLSPPLAFHAPHQHRLMYFVQTPPTILCKSNEASHPARI